MEETNNAIHTEHEHHAEKVHNIGKPLNMKSGILKNVDYNYFIAGGIYLLIALIMFYQITFGIFNTAPGAGGDTYQNLWDIWWVSYSTFSLHTSFYSTNLLFWPIGSNLIYQTMSPIGSILSAPFQAISVPFAYNVLFFLGFLLSGLGMYALSDYFVKNKYAAFVAGLIFAFSAFHIAQAYSHIDWINIEWVPLALLFFIKMIKDEKKIVSAVLLAVSFVLVAFMGDLQQAIMTVLLLALVWIAYFVNKDTRALAMSKNFLISFLVFVVVAFIVGSWGFLPVIGAVTQSGGLSNANYLNDAAHNELWSANLLSFFVPSYYNGLFNGLVSGYYYSIAGPIPTEGIVYIGYVALALGIYGIMKNYKSTRLWIAVAVVFLLLALGPYLQIGTYLSPIPTLYSIYHAVPVISVIREPGRFDMIVMLAVAMLAAFGTKSLIENSNKIKEMVGNPKVLVAIIAILFLLENNGLPFGNLASQTSTKISVPAFYSDLGTQQGNYSLYVLPLLPNSSSIYPALYPGAVTYYSAFAKKPLVGGYVTRENLSQQLSILNIPLTVEAYNLETTGIPTYPSVVIQNYTNQTLLAFSSYGVAYAAIEKGAFGTSALQTLEGYMVNLFGQPVYNDNTTIAFSTTAAEANSIYESYVAYPKLTDWGENQTLINGSAHIIWTPLATGSEIIVYAPYQNATALQNRINPTQVSVVNTTIGFSALSVYPGSTLKIYGQTSQGAVVLGSFNITSKLSDYSFRVRMVSGPYGNPIFFVPSSPAGIGIVNVTFIRG